MPRARSAGERAFATSMIDRGDISPSTPQRYYTRPRGRQYGYEHGRPTVDAKNMRYAIYLILLLRHAILLAGLYHYCSLVMSKIDDDMGHTCSPSHAIGAAGIESRRTRATPCRCAPGCDAADVPPMASYHDAKSSLSLLRRRAVSSPWPNSAMPRLLMRHFSFYRAAADDESYQTIGHAKMDRRHSVHERSR